MGVPASVVGLILGGIAKKKGNRSGLRRAGVICSVVGILLTVVVIALGVVVALDYMETAHLTFTETENGLAIYVKAGEYPEHMELPSAYNGTPVVASGENAFTHSEKLQEIVIPEGVTVIGDFAFRDCPKLTSIELPASLESIGIAAFFTDSNLKTIRYHGTKEQWYRIEKARNWYEKKQYGKLEIICEDGTITLTEE